METVDINKLIDYLNNRFGGSNFSVLDGKKYYKIVINDNSVYCFVVKEDSTTKGLGTVKKGDLLRPASWNTPAKHARGNFFDETTWITAFDKFGMAYLK